MLKADCRKLKAKIWIQKNFCNYVQAENKVEPKDMMPEDYRKLLVETDFSTCSF